MKANGSGTNGSHGANGTGPAGNTEHSSVMEEMRLAQAELDGVPPDLRTTFLFVRDQQRGRETDNTVTVTALKKQGVDLNDAATWNNVCSLLNVRPARRPAFRAKCKLPPLGEASIGAEAALPLANGALAADKDQVAQFVELIFRHVKDRTKFVSLRAFEHEDDRPPVFVRGIKLKDPEFLKTVVIYIGKAANYKSPAVFCPPVALFDNAIHATTTDLVECPVLSVECDERPGEALRHLSEVLGPPTVTVASGGVWTNPETGEVEDKLHGHWRLRVPTRTPEEHEKLRQARALATRLVGADASAVAPVHPLRWPGSWHTKNKDQPRLARIVLADADVEIDLDAALAALREIVGDAGAHEPAGERVATDAEMCAFAIGRLADYRADVRDEWIKVGLAIKGAFAHDDERGFQLFDEFSRRCSEKYDKEANLRRRYAGFSPSSIGAGSLVFWADEDDPTWREAYDRKLEADVYGDAGNAERKKLAEDMFGDAPQANGHDTGAGEHGIPPFAGDRQGAEAAGARARTSAGEQRQQLRDKTALASKQSRERAPSSWRETRGKSGKPRPSLHNARVAILRLGVRCRYDRFHEKVLVGHEGTDKWHEVREVVGELTDLAETRLRQMISDHYGFDPTAQHVHDALKTLALEHSFDPVLDLLDEAQAAWDGTPRLDNWVVTYLGCEDTRLNRAIGRKVLIAAARRARKPGCKFDNITTLEGEEGKMKSTAIRILAGDENFSDQGILGARDKEVQELLAGVWMHECADLTGMRKADVEHVKAFASRMVDRARPAYGRVTERRPRRSIEWATTNDTAYLLSQTGNRRFWPLRTGKIKIDELARDRLQLLGEAAKYEAEGESLVLDEKLWPDAAEAQEARRVRHPWEDILADIPETVPYFKKDGQEYEQVIIHHMHDGTQQVASKDLLEFVLKIPPGRRGTADSMRLADAMRALKWQRHTNGKVTIDGKRVAGFWRPDEGAQTEMEMPEPVRQEGAWEEGVPFPS